MKKFVSILICIAMFMGFCSVDAFAEFSESSIAISCDDGKIIVSGSFHSDNAGENYKVLLVNFNENGEVIKRVLGISDATAIESGMNTVNYSVDIPDLMADSELVRAYVWTDSLEPVCEPAEKTITSLKVLALGSSFNIDSTRQLYYIAEDAGIDNIVVANIYNGSSTLAEHCTNLAEDNAAYSYYKNANGDWLKDEEQRTILYGLTDEKWNMIILNQGARLSGVSSSYENYLETYAEYVAANKTNPDARIAWNTAWAIKDNYNQYVESTQYNIYDNDQMTMYNAVVDAVKINVVPMVESGVFSMIIPTGTAIQNVRSSFIGDTVDRDGLHLSQNVGRYTAALTLFKFITGQSIDSLTYVPKICDDVMITPTHLAAIKEAVNNAVIVPFEVTQSTYTVAPAPDAENTPGKIAAPEGVKLNFNQMTATASSTTTSADLAIDGDGTTSTSRWTSKLAANKIDGPHSLTIDLKSVRKVSDIGIKWLRGDNRHYYFCIEVSSDGVTYTPVENLGLYDPDSTKSVQSSMLLSALDSNTQYFSLGDREARYIRYWGHGNDSEQDLSALYYNHVLEIEVYLQEEATPVPGLVSAPVGTLLAQSLINATDMSEVASDTAGAAIDGSVDTYWQSNSGNNKDKLGVIIFDLGEVKTVSDIGIEWFASGRKYCFCIEVSTDGESWKYIDNMGTAESRDAMINSEGKKSAYYSLGNANARYIRYSGLGNSANKYNQVCEFNVYIA